MGQFTNLCPFVYYCVLAIGFSKDLLKAIDPCSNKVVDEVSESVKHTLS